MQDKIETNIDLLLDSYNGIWCYTSSDVIMTPKLRSFRCGQFANVGAVSVPEKDQLIISKVF